MLAFDRDAGDCAGRWRLRGQGSDAQANGHLFRQTADTSQTWFAGSVQVVEWRDEWFGISKPMSLKKAHSAMCVQTGKDRSLHIMSRGFEECDTECRNAKAKGQSTGSRHRYPDSSEVTGPDANAESVQIVPVESRLIQNFREHWEKPLGLAFGHVLVAHGQAAPTRKKSGPAIRGRCVESKNQWVRQPGAPR